MKYANKPQNRNKSMVANRRPKIISKYSPPRPPPTNEKTHESMAETLRRRQTVGGLFIIYQIESNKYIKY